MRWGSALAVSLATGGLAFAALRAGAQDASLPPPILHEYIEPPAASAARRVVDPDAPAVDVFGPEPSAGRNPSAFRAGAKILPKPTRGSPDGQEPVLGRHGFAADRETEARPDYQTSADGTLHYVEVFNPSVVPFKRMTALDAVREDYTLYSAATALEDLDVGGEPTPDEDLFWGNLVIDFHAGEDVPIPSVAPDMRVVSYEVEPRTSVSFSKDGADNFYARADEPGASGTHRLVFLAAAPARYFAPAVPAGYRVRDLDRARVRPLPERVRAIGLRALARLGVQRDMPLDQALDKLVAYFREFQAGDSPASTGDIYWDLLVSQIGVCRHRAFAFMVTANALGIPARYVANEAHAWVEVWVPENGWLRVDLGGAASRLQISNAADKSMYRPRGDDPFTQPEAYANNYTRLEGDVQGLSPDQIREAQQPAGGGAGENPDGSGGGSADSEPPRRAPAPGRSLPQLPQSSYAGKAPTKISVDAVDPTGFRGETIQVGGKLVNAAGVGLPGQRIDLYLAPSGYAGESAELIGHTVSAPDGSFSAVVTVPRDLDLRDYEVFAASPGTPALQPALSE